MSLLLSLFSHSRGRLLTAILITVLISSYLVALRRHDIAPLIWDSDLAGNPNAFKTPNGSVPQRGEVVLVTASSGTSNFLGIPNLKNMVYENRMSWANRWGYEFMWANITSYDHGEHVVWNKIPILKEAFVRFPKAKWLYWLDIDIIIMTPSINLHDHVLTQAGMNKNGAFGKELGRVGGGSSGYTTPTTVDENQVNFIISSDHWGMNAGSFLMRRSDWTDWLLDMWDDPLYIKADWVMKENQAWTHMFTNHEIIRNHTSHIAQKGLNSYPSYNFLGEHWSEGDLLVHFAGCGGSPKCAQNWDDMWVQRENYTVPDFVKEELASGKAKIETVQMGKSL